MRGYHAYVDIWTPVIVGGGGGEVLLVKRETNNSHNVTAVAVYRVDTITDSDRASYRCPSMHGH